MTKETKTLVYTLIGIFIMLIGFVLPPMGVVTQMGMRITCIFLGTLFLWNCVGGPWTSLLAIAMVGLSGYMESFVITVDSAIGNDTILLVMFAFILFGGGLTDSQCMKHVTTFILTRKFVAGRPYVILGIIGLCSYLLAFVVNQMVSAIIMFAIVAAICRTVNIEHGKDPIWVHLFGMIFLGAGMGQPGFVYKGIGVTMIKVFINITQGTSTISANGYMLYNFIMSMLFILVYILLIKFFFRTDVSKLKGITVESIRNASGSEPITKTQKWYLWMVVLFLAMTILPSIGSLGTLPVLNLLKSVNVLGILIFWVILFSIIRVDGAPLLNIQKHASQGIIWNILLMVGAGIMLGQAMGDAELGVIVAIKQFVTPILVGKPTLFIVFVIYLTALIITQFAVNLAMAIALMPIVVACAAELGLDPAPIALGVMMICFIAMATPAASPLAAFCYGEEKYFTPKEIQSYAFILCFVGLLLFTFIGYPLASILVNIP